MEGVLHAFYFLNILSRSVDRSDINMAEVIKAFLTREGLLDIDWRTILEPTVPCSENSIPLPSPI